jgi:hypothetical protein
LCFELAIAADFSSTTLLIRMKSFAYLIVGGLMGEPTPPVAPVEKKQSFSEKLNFRQAFCR